VVFFGRQAEIVKQYLHKGSKIYVEGRLQTEKWQDKNGVDRYTTKIIASPFQMQMLDSRSDGGAGGYGAQGAGGYSPYAQPAQQQPAGGYPAPPPVNQPAGNYSAPPPVNQGMGQPAPSYSNEGMGQQPTQPIPPPTGGSEGMSQSTQSTPSPATGATNPQPDKGLNDDVPF
jgi:single-strand DNA-binding protein